MTFSQYRETFSWQGAIDLGPKLMRLAEELPATEEMGLSWHLRQLMVEVPAAIGADLVQGRPADPTAVLKLISALELIDQVYPALDTAAARTTADELIQRLSSGRFAETPGGMQKPEAAAPEAATDTGSAGSAEPAAPADTPLVPAEDIIGPTARTSVPVSAEPPTPAQAAAPSQSAPASPAAPAPQPTVPEDTDVHPNSV